MPPSDDEEDSEEEVEAGPTVEPAVWEVERAARVAKEEMAEVAAARRRLSDVRGQGRAAAAAAAAAVALEDTHAEAVTNGECVSPSPATPLKSAGAAVAGGVAGAAMEAVGAVAAGVVAVAVVSLLLGRLRGLVRNRGRKRRRSLLPRR